MSVRTTAYCNEFWESWQSVLTAHTVCTFCQLVWHPWPSNLPYVYVGSSQTVHSIFCPPHVSHWSIIPVNLSSYTPFVTTGCNQISIVIACIHDIFSPSNLWGCVSVMANQIAVFLTMAFNGQAHSGNIFTLLGGLERRSWYRTIRNSAFYYQCKFRPNPSCRSWENRRQSSPKTSLVKCASYLQVTWLCSHHSPRPTVYPQCDAGHSSLKQQHSWSAHEALRVTVANNLHAVADP